MARTVLECLIARYPTAKRQTLKRMVQAGRVRAGGRKVRTLKDPVGDREVLDVDESPVTTAPSRRKSGLNIVFEDEDLLVVDKPAGLLTSTVPREPRATLLAMVRDYAAMTSERIRIGLIHRLDREASGLLVFSKTDEAYQALKEQLFRRTMQRAYVALVHGAPQPPAGRLESFLVERADGTVYSTKQHGKGERAVTDYETIEAGKKRSLLRVTLKTGRKHQIRVHLKEKGTPIVGDDMYGNDRNKAPRLMLAAVKLGLKHPRTGREMEWEIRLPADFVLVEPRPAAKKTPAVKRP